jgi:hypothetical protein
MSKTLLAVVSCHTRPEFSDAIRRTWAPEIPAGKADVLFFLGRGPKAPKEDEIILDCGDSHSDLPEKVREIVRWAYTQGYEHVFKLDDDVILIPKRFLRSGFDKFDYIGYNPTGQEGHENDLKWTWGFCYGLSRKAMACVISAPAPCEVGDEVETCHKGNDEFWIGRVLFQKGLYLHPELRYHLRTGNATERPEVPGVFLFCVHMHDSMSTPQEVHEMCRIWRERCQNG